MDYILSRLKEFNTFSAVILFLGGIVGHQFAPELISSMHVILISALSALGLLTPDN